MLHLRLSLHRHALLDIVLLIGLRCALSLAISLRSHLLLHLLLPGIRGGISLHLLALHRITTLLLLGCSPVCRRLLLIVSLGRRGLHCALSLAISLGNHLHLLLLLLPP